MKHFAIAFAYCFIVGPYAVPIAQALLPFDHILPAQICPPSDWPLTKESRAKYQPFDNWNHTIQIFTS